MAHPRDDSPPERLPRHVVLIPDGNGRWATEHHKPVPEGHLQGARAVEAFLSVCQEWKIEVVTVWAFSTENWGRSAAEVDAIMRLIALYLRRNRPRFKRDGIRLRHIGRTDRIAARHPKLAQLLVTLQAETAAYEPFTLNLALDYGGRDEIVRAIARLIAEGCRPQECTWERLAASLDTHGLPDPDLILRTSGEHRLSGILPLQGAYAELVFYPSFLPQMREAEFRDAIRQFAARDRRFGTRPVEAGEERS